ncbi:hypothetical protein GH984_06005 [Spiribacter sp. C176]|uniref:Glycosyl transferase CAP10 domain-containing protein n=1 Tax=Spiribacter salilacus TaxID=2664894 RepID=A0A6N7QP11_9GAMM|nr:glycosyl transferase family 90 [Spiribacter salilacus]MRH78255.1 hypothetical protein [Spiribacter salilacus]
MVLHHHLRFWLGYLLGKYPLKPVDPDPFEVLRIQYYCKEGLDRNLEPSPVPINSISLKHKTGYAYDWYRIFNKSDKRLCHVEFGDVQHLTPKATFCKSRPIQENNQNNVLLPLNTARHFNFKKDPYPFAKKRSNGIWRGSAYKDKRLRFLKSVSDIEFVDAADTSRHSNLNYFGKSRNHLSVREQMRSQFIFSIEGNDVATNLKWIMASNSVPVMAIPEFETWFCEGKLVPGQHFIEILPDFSNIGDVLEYHLERPKLSAEIAEESKLFSAQFKNFTRQFGLARHVVERYFQLIR